MVEKADGEFVVRVDGLEDCPARAEKADEALEQAKAWVWGGLSGRGHIQAPDTTG
jgi:predicted RNase H-like HicB family nuclease